LKSGIAADWSVNRKIRNKVTAMVRSAKQQYFSNLATHMSHDSRKFWRSFQHLSSRQKAQTTIADTSCDAINQHFLTIAQKTIADLPSSSVSPLSSIDRVDVPDLSLSEVQFNDVVQYIQVLDVHKAVGIDGISTCFIKASPYGMAVVLTKPINKSILACTFPDIWKTAIVTPVQKSKQNSSLSNYRPISVLPVVSKILERVVFDAIVCHLLKHDLLSNKQSGFCPGYSTQDVCYMLQTPGLKQLMMGNLWALFLSI